MANVNRSVRCPVKRALKPSPPPSASTHVVSSKTTADVQYILPANRPQIETVSINTATVAQPFLQDDESTTTVTSFQR
ncbi:hypothetical protein E4U43_004116 [Claviceps pusilla]|uniref:Uncharacterized protein n=1 Tax=Claviceps pusilla TaxID=123648 RepID=A0A9P7SX43_9HYPO|nr:hypothetical protein E4U43_004116 [Claviceps pusilla]